MNVPIALNIFFGPAVFIILIFIECAVKYSSDRNLKNVFLTFLIITFLFLIVDFVFFMLTDISAKLSCFTGIEVEGNISRVIINYFPIFIAAGMVMYLRKIYKQINLAMILLLNFFTVSLGISVLVGSVKFIWPALAALFLFAYLFVILSENKTDLLTGLDNRFSFFEFTNRLSGSKTGDSWIIAMLDINNIRSINEIYGHLEGDNALRVLAQAIKANSRKHDFTARFGGDEFVIVTRAEAGIDDLITSIENDLEKYNNKNEKPYNIEICYGYDTYTADGSRPIDDFINHVDKLVRKHNEENRRAGDLGAGRQL